MKWSEAIKAYTDNLPTPESSAALAARLIPLIDLTALNDTDTESSVAALCEKAVTPLGNVAAVCVYPQFVPLVSAQLAGGPIKIATVVNFPEGQQSLTDVLVDISRALADGANEIDIVIPYHRYLAGERHYLHDFVAAARAACGLDASLKVILETGALLDPAIIADASYDVLGAGADFIKTSTGKLSPGATLDAATTMLLVIKHASSQLKHPVGIKVSGGIREWQQAANYIALADAIMGEDWVRPATFRIGASQLLDNLLLLA